MKVVFDVLICIQNYPEKLTDNASDQGSEGAKKNSILFKVKEGAQKKRNTILTEAEEGEEAEEEEEEENEEEEREEK